MSILPSRVMESAILTLLVVGVELAQKSPTLKRIGQNSRFYKPSSVSRFALPQKAKISAIAIHLRQTSPLGWCDPPLERSGNPPVLE